MFHQIAVNCLILITLASAYTDPSTCSQLYNYLTHSCQSCPTNTAVAEDKTYCNCTGSYYPNPEALGFNHPTDSCIDLGSSPGAGQIISMYERSGALNPQLETCTDSYPNSNNTACIPCGYEMTYDSTDNICQCKDTNHVAVGEACITKPSYTNPYSQGINKILYDISRTGCLDREDHDSCQVLLNQCAASDYNNDNNFCDLLISNSNSFLKYKSSYENLARSLDIYASSIPGTNTTSVKNKLSFKLLQYNSWGQLLDIKPLDEDIVPCLATEEDIIKLQSFGLNLKKQCEDSDRQTSSDFYDVFVLDKNGRYVEVYSIFQPNSSNYYRRIKPSQVGNSIDMEFVSTPPLSTPFINFTGLSTPSILTSSQQESFTLTLVAPFVIMNIGIAIIFVANFYKYIKYNPDETNDPYYFFKALLIFLLMALKHWGVGMWIWLFGVSTYCFCFYKFQRTVFLLLPDMETDWFPYYDSFMALFYVQWVFVLFSVFLLIYDMGSTTDYFLIDWEKEKNASNFDINMGHNKRQASVWRKVLLVNQLYELTITRLINIEFVTLFSLLFLEGLNWINLSYEIPNTQNLNNDSSSTKNIVLSYFIITFIFFIISVIQYIVRHMLRLKLPLPHEDFVDLCSISNISIVIFDQALHGYYIHGMNPLGQAEGSLNYIDSIFEKEARSYGKSRAFRNDDPDQVQTFEVLFPFEIRQAFQMKYKTQYLQKLVGKAYNTSMFSKPIPEMLDENDYKEIEAIQNDMLNSFKYYLQGVKTSQFNIKDRTFLQKLVSCPMDMQLIGKLPIFFKDYWNEFTNVLMCGHEFLFLVNTINFVNIFYVATDSVFFATFITMCLSRLLIKNFADFMVKRNISKNTLIDDKFFN